jgi:4-nitrophenyl phosphatase
MAGPLNASLFVLDMDGTIYLGDKLFPWTLPFLEAVAKAGADYLFLTNNSSKTSAQYVDKLQVMGIPATPDSVMTSGDATIELLRRERGWQRIFLLATPAVEEEFRRAGFELTAEEAQGVVLAFDTTLTWEKLCTCCHLLRTGLPFVASHPDINCPSPAGPLPDVGSFLALIKSSCGREPDLVVGKPRPDFLRAAMFRKGVTPEETIIVGDRLYTDIACGIAAGVRTALVLSGESTRELVAESPHQPDWVVENLSELLLRD